VGGLAGVGRGGVEAQDRPLGGQPVMLHPSLLVARRHTAAVPELAVLVAADERAGQAVLVGVEDNDDPGRARQSLVQPPGLGGGEGVADPPRGDPRRLDGHDRGGAQQVPAARGERQVLEDAREQQQAQRGGLVSRHGARGRR
jgi:hypothetical protein